MISECLLSLCFVRCNERRQTIIPNARLNVSQLVFESSSFGRQQTEQLVQFGEVRLVGVELELDGGEAGLAELRHHPARRVLVREEGHEH